MASVQYSAAHDVATFRLWFPSLAPQLMLGLGGTLALLCAFGAYILAINQPSVGITWTATAETYGLVVNNVSRTEKHFPIVSGDRLTAIKKTDGNPISLHSGLIIDDPDIHLSYADYNNFFSQQSLLADVLQNPLIEFMDDDGHSYTVSTRERRPLGSLPFAFWIYNIGGFISFMITLGVWCYRRSYPSARLLVLSGLGFFFAVLCLSVYGTRELALDGGLFQVLTTANHFFMLLMTYSLLGLFWYFPQRLGRSGIIIALYFAMLVFWLNETFQWYQVPLHPFYVLTFLVPYMLAVPLAIVQWRRSRRKPDKRAAFKWLLLAILISMGAAIAVFVIPPINRVYLVLSLETSTLIVLVMYIGFALGILRYRLFDLDRWWFSALTGLLGLVLLVVLDVSMLHLLSLRPSTAIALSLFAIVWLYFPARQWLWARLIDPPERHLEQYLPSLVESLFLESEDGGLVRSWNDFLKKIYHPLEIRAHNNADSSTTIDQDGLVIRTRLPIRQGGVELIGKRRGTRLFGTQDVALIEAILVLAQRFIRLQISHEETAAKERRRIERILHDDVGAKLRTLEYIVSTQEEKMLARSAFDALTDVRNRLLTRNNALLEECLGDWRAEINMRIDPLLINLHWLQPTNLEGIWLTPVQTVNCRSILRETVTNIIRHSHATDITMVFHIEEKKQKLTIRVSDNGDVTDLSTVFTMNDVGGHGIVNMQKCAEEMQGTIKIIKTEATSDNEPRGLTLILTIPLNVKTQNITA